MWTKLMIFTGQNPSDSYFLFAEEWGYHVDFVCYWSEHCMVRPSLWFVTGQNTVWYDQVYDLLLVSTLYATTKFMICYWSEHCMLWPSLWFVTGQYTVCYDQVYDLLLVRTYVMTKYSYICWLSEYCMFDQVYDLLLVRTLYVTTKFMICYWSERCMLRPSWWFVTGQNAVCVTTKFIRLCYDQAYDLLLVRTLYVTISNSYIYIDCCVHIVFYQVYDLLLVKILYVTTKFMICYWSEHCMLRPSLWFVTGQLHVCWPSLWFVTGQNTMLRPSLWFVTFQNAICYDQVNELHKLTVCYIVFDQVYDLLLVRTLYVTTKFTICFWSEHCMLRPSWWFVTGQNTIVTTKFMICYFSEPICYDK